MDMIIFSVKLGKFRLKVSTDISEYLFEIVKDSLGKNATTILCHKDQVDMHSKNTMSSCAYLVDIFHRPTIFQQWSDCKRINFSFSPKPGKSM